MTATYEFVRSAGLLPGVFSTTGYAAAGAIQGVHRGLPSPSLTFIFSLDDPIVTAVSPEQLPTGRAGRNLIITGGLHTAPAYVSQPPAQSGIQLAVHPLAARALFGVPATELGFPVTDGEDVLGAAAEHVRTRLAETPDWDGRFAVLQAYLRRRVDRAGCRAAVRPELGEAWNWLARHRGNGSIDGLARHVLLSPRQLRTLFTREIGVGPKTVNRLLRFQQVIRAIGRPVASGEPVDLARIAADCGYFDQSHLTRAFRQFTGTSPTGWLAEERRNLQAGGHRNGQD
ncbi:helix-turn-helix domain-containing protein [Nakamurella lactea]|uniref:helix-turn-helix domain-containing protein n=1 Tax=Nakamurella lactea TaxID=459515 RepID=UPI0003F5FD80|nr:helix-turn-helix domain-containing protein [Nakamurella lactea]